MRGVIMKKYSIIIASSTDLDSTLKGLVKQHRLNVNIQCSNVNIQCSNKQVSRLNEKPGIEETLVKRAEYFTFLNDRGLI